MVVTLKDVAKRAGVAVPTASLILNGRNLRYSEATKKAVLEAAEVLGYRPDSMAHRTGRQSKRRDAVGLLVRSKAKDRLDNTPLYEYMCGINDLMLEESQFLVTVKLALLHEKESTARPRLIAERFIDGLIVETGLPPTLEHDVRRYGIFCVWVNSDHHDPFDCVYPDELHAGRLASEHLLALGHRRVIYVASPDYIDDTKKVQHYSVEDRPKGYFQAMQGADLEPEIVAMTPEVQESYARIVKTVVDSHQGDEQAITGVVTHSIDAVPRIREGLLMSGLKCPEDVSLVAADDMHATRRNWPEITGVSCDRYQMGRWAARMMLDKVDQEGAPQQSKVFRGDLYEGQTASPVADKAN